MTHIVQPGESTLLPLPFKSLQIDRYKVMTIGALELDGISLPPGQTAAKLECLEAREKYAKALLTLTSLKLRPSWLRMHGMMPVIKRILNYCRMGFSK